MNSLSNETLSSRSASNWNRTSSGHLHAGQIVAVISGEGQGWMAVIVNVRTHRSEPMYTVILGDGRTLTKADCDLAELNAIGDAGWPEPSLSGH